MRLLNSEELSLVGGGTGGQKATQIIFNQTTNPNVETVKDTGHWTTQITSSTPFSAGVTFEMSGVGKVFSIKGGVNVALPSDIHVITTNDKTNEMRDCNLTTHVCTIYDSSGHVVSQKSAPMADSGWEQLMNNLDVFDQADNLLVGGAGNETIIFDSGTEPGGYQPADYGPQLASLH